VAETGARAGGHAAAGVEVRLRDAPDGIEELGGVGAGDVGSARVDAAGIAEGLPAAPRLPRAAWAPGAASSGPLTRSARPPADIDDTSSRIAGRPGPTATGQST